MYHRARPPRTSCAIGCGPHPLGARDRRRGQVGLQVFKTLLFGSGSDPYRVDNKEKRRVRTSTTSGHPGRG